MCKIFVIIGALISGGLGIAVLGSTSDVAAFGHRFGGFN